MYGKIKMQNNNRRTESQGQGQGQGQGPGNRRPAGVAPAGGARALSNDEFDYKTHVLYVIPGNKASQIAQEMAAKSNDIQITNILTIAPSKRPPWLNGAPTLIDIRTQQLFKGSQALKTMEELSTQTITGANSRIGIGYDFDTFQSTAKTCSSGCEIVPMLDDENKYSNKTPKVNETSITRMMEARSTDPRQVSQSSKGALPM
jgi:hypothetical protein